jgi:hypothetical protein
MSIQTLEVQAQTLEVARQDLQKKLSPGIVVLRETVLADGSSKIVEGKGATVEEAVQKAKANIPPNATIEGHVLQPPTRETIQVDGFDESEVRRKAVVAKPKRIDSVSIKESGHKGFIGIGRRPHTYDIVITQLALIKIKYRQPAVIRAEVGTLVDKYCRQLSRLSDAECAAIIRGTSATETTALLEALKGYSGKEPTQTLLATIDHLATGPEPSRQLAMQFLVAKGFMPTTGFKIAYELRERALHKDEITMPLSGVVDQFRKTPAWGKERARSALEFVRKFFGQSTDGRDKFEERYAYYSRQGTLVTEADFLSRCNNILLCRQCGQPMTQNSQGPYVQLRCEQCDITRFEKTVDV